MNLEFLSSNRFWALVISSLVIVAEGDFTTVAWLKGLQVLVTGFIAIRTIDRAGEKVGNK